MILAKGQMKREVRAVAIEKEPLTLGPEKVGRQGNKEKPSARGANVFQNSRSRDFFGRRSGMGAVKIPTLGGIRTADFAATG